MEALALFTSLVAQSSADSGPLKRTNSFFAPLADSPAAGNIPYWYCREERHAACAHTPIPERSVEMLNTAALRNKNIEPAVNSLQSLRRIGGFGLMMGVSIMAGFYLGSYIDGHLDTYPVFMLLMVILAIIGGFIELFRNAGILGGTR
jgi:hypothetical protein